MEYPKIKTEGLLNQNFLSILWKDQAVDGRRRTRWDGNGKEKGLERKNTREK